MSLAWDITDIADADSLWTYNMDGENILSPLTEVLIHLTTNVGLNEITQKNYKTFYRRIKELEVAYGMRGFLTEPENQTRMPFLNEVQRHIGLKTNAEVLTNRKFSGHLRRQVEFTTNELIAREKEIEDGTQEDSD